MLPRPRELASPEEVYPLVKAIATWFPFAMPFLFILFSEILKICGLLKLDNEF